MFKLDNITAGYDTTPVLHGLSLQLARGEMVALLGRNGAGKTTTLRAAVGALPLEAGSIRLDNEEIGALPTHERSRRGLAYVPQGRDIFPSLSVQENLLVAAYGSRCRDEKAQLAAVYEEFPMLADKRHERGGGLSGGQQQILALGRALMTSPRVLLLDEPSEGIQPSIVEQIAGFIRDIHHRQGLTVIIVEQNLDFAASIAQRACLMDKGRVVCDLPSREVLEDRELQRQYLGL